MKTPYKQQKISLFSIICKMTVSTASVLFLSVLLGMQKSACRDALVERPAKPVNFGQPHGFSVLHCSHC